MLLLLWLLLITSSSTLGSVALCQRLYAFVLIARVALAVRALAGFAPSPDMTCAHANAALALVRSSRRRCSSGTLLKLSSTLRYSERAAAIVLAHAVANDAVTKLCFSSGSD